MYLTSTNLVYYLVGRGTITRSSVVDGDFQVHELDGRNRCFKIPRVNHPSLFVKQIKVIDAKTVECLEREATCYRSAQSGDRFAPLAQVMPRFVDYDAERHATIVEMPPYGEDLRDCHRWLATYPVEIGDLLGRRLGRYHADIARTLNGPNGHAGNAELMIMASDRLSRPELRQAAETVGTVCIDRYSDTGVPWPCGVDTGWEGPTLMLGLAGIGHFYLRLAEPKAVRSVLITIPSEYRASRHRISK